MPRLSRLLLPFAVAAPLIAAAAPVASASSDQEAIFQTGVQVRTDPVGTLASLRALGVTRLRLLIDWNTVAPNANSRRKPGHFNSTQPGSYPAANWAIYDRIIRTAKADGIGIDLNVTGPAPLWATGSGAPRGGPYGQWKPSAREWGGFVRAVGTRYSGHYHSLPRVSFWSIWNEPNYGVDLAPQASQNDTVEVGAGLYRGLVDAAWSALHASGHGRDTILIGETAPRGLDHPIGNFSGVKPLRFLRALYCVDSRYRQLRGSAASARGCPNTGSGSRRFRSQHPGLFSASGFSDHPYPGIYSLPPNVPTGLTTSGRSNDPDFADLPKIPVLERVLDRLNRIYGSGTRFPIWSTEYGYQTRPPSRDHRAISPATGAYYINWGEYLSWRQPRIRSYTQFLLQDPPAGNFASGLESAHGTPKPAYNAYRLPLFLPSTSTRRSRSLEVWGDARAAHLLPGSAHVAIQLQAGSRGAFKTLKTVIVTNRRGYFDVRQAFPSSGSVRLAWTEPNGHTVFSRTQKITVR